MTTPPTSDGARALAVVTGASSGIGLELARLFAADGYPLVVTAEDAAIHDVAGQLPGVSVEAVQADLATRAGCEALVSHVGDRAVDALVLNAGVGVGGPFLETDLEAELAMINLNVVSVVYVAKRLLPAMVARGHGRVLVTSSIAAQMPAPFEAVYAGTKAFELVFAEGIRNELKDTGVTVTALQPGPTETNFFHRAGMDDTRVGQSDAKDDAAKVARDGYAAMMAGRDHVVAGSLMNKLQSVLLEAMPETLKAELHRKLSEPGSGKR
jgi:short-subunit dehydrogenase